MPIMPPTAAQQPSYPSDREALWKAVRALEQRLERPAPPAQAKTGIVTTSRPTVRVLGASVDRDVWRVNSGATLEVGDEVVCVETALGLVVLSVVEEPPLGPYVPPAVDEGIYVESRLSTESSSDYMFTGVGLGTPHPDRHVVFVVHRPFPTSDWSGSRTLITFPADEDVWISSGDSSTWAAGFFDSYEAGYGGVSGSANILIAAIPDGETADIRVRFTAAKTLALQPPGEACWVSTYRLIPNSGEVIRVANRASSWGDVDPPGTALTLADGVGASVLPIAGGWIIGTGMSRADAPTPSWSGMTADAAVAAAGRGMAVASGVVPASPHSARLTWSGSLPPDEMACAAVFQSVPAS